MHANTNPAAAAARSPLIIILFLNGSNDCLSQAGSYSLFLSSLSSILS
jgi:hypothetical protein